jgi:hypothetical protein
MLFRTLKSNSLLALFTIIMASIMLWLGVLLMHVSFTSGHGYPAALSNQSSFPFLFHWADSQPLAGVITAYLFVILNGFAWNFVLRKYSVLLQNTWLPVFVFILLLSSKPSFFTFHALLPANLMLILAFNRLFSSYNKEKAFSESFDCGLFTGIAALIYFPSIIFFPFMLLALGIIGTASWRDWLICIIGLFIPLYFTFSIGKIFHINFISPFTIFNGIHFAVPNPIDIKEIVSIGIILIIFLFCFPYFINKISFNSVKAQKSWLLLIWFILFTLILVFIFPLRNGRGLLFFSLPFTVIFSNYFLRTDTKRITDVLFFLFIVSIVISDFLPSHFITLLHLTRN